MKKIIIALLLLSFSSSFAQQKFGNLSYHDNIDFFGYVISKMEKSRINSDIYAITIDANDFYNRFSISIFNGKKWTNITSDKYDYPYPDTVELYDLALGKNNVLWLASSVGAIKYDGNTWETFTPPIPSSPSGLKRWYRHLAIDSSGNAIFSSELSQFLGKKDGTNYYKGFAREIIKIEDGAMSNIYYSDTTENAVEKFYSQSIEDLQVAPNGNLWAVCVQPSSNIGGLIKYNSEHKWEEIDLKTKFDNKYVRYPKSIQFVDDGKLLISFRKSSSDKTRGGISTYDPKNKTWDILEDYGKLSDSSRNAFFESFDIALKSSNGDIWAGDQYRLTRIKAGGAGTDTYSPYTAFNQFGGINDIVEDEKGVIWIATGFGLMSYDYSANGVESQETNEQNIGLSPNVVQNGEVSSLVYSFPNNLQELDAYIVDMQGHRQALFSTTRVQADTEYTYHLDNMSKYATGKYYIELHADDKINKVALIIIN